MRILVTGAGGFVGRATLDALSAVEDAEVIATDLLGALPEGGVALDLLRDDAASLLRNVDVVIHIAGLFDLDASIGELRRVNVEGTRRLLAASIGAGVLRFVHVSSVTVYGRPGSGRTFEDAPIRPASPYEISKAEGEAIVWGAGARIEAVVARPSGIFGPGGRGGLAHLFAMYALEAHDHRGGVRAYRGGPRMTHVHVQDVGRALVHLATTDHDVSGRAFNIADDTPLPWGDLMAHLESIFGVDAGAPQALPRWKAQGIARLWSALPASRRQRINASLERRWKRLAEEHGLVPALAPHIERHAYEYWRGDHVYANDALRETGFALGHPDPLPALTQTVQALRRARWLP